MRTRKSAHNKVISNLQSVCVTSDHCVIDRKGIRETLLINLLELSLFQSPRNGGKFATILNNSLCIHLKSRSGTVLWMMDTQKNEQSKNLTPLSLCSPLKLSILQSLKVSTAAAPLKAALDQKPQKLEEKIIF